MPLRHTRSEKCKYHDGDTWVMCGYRAEATFASSDLKVYFQKNGAIFRNFSRIVTND